MWVVTGPSGVFDARQTPSNSMRIDGSEWPRHSGPRVSRRSTACGGLNVRSCTEAQSWQAQAMQGVMADLEWRRLVHQVTDPQLAKLLDGDTLTAYAGLDPTADSLHVGHLLQLFNLRRLQRGGHRAIGLLGGGTGMIGDPGGRTEERQLLDPEQLAANLAGIRTQIEHLLEPGAVILDNADWLADLRVIDFLRDIGKHFSVNEMIRKESVKLRLEGREQGISYTEFSYMLLQAYDFLHLFDELGCRLQIGGSDQWGNITEGIELIRRLRGEPSYGLTSPLITLPGGDKMGKSVAGTVWLDPAKTSPYQFFQYWLRSEDEHVGTYLRRLTFLERARIEELEAATAEHPERREAQRVLARELTTLVHGAEETAKAEHAAEVLFGEDVVTLAPETIEGIAADSNRLPLRRSELEAGFPLANALALATLTSQNSSSEGRRVIKQGGAYVNGKRESDVERQLTPADLIHGRFIFLRKGKRDFCVIEVG
jgi:tyrosyl-tRNA synthetase